MGSISFFTAYVILCSSLLSYKLGQVESQSTGWSGCVNPNEPDKPEVLQIGKAHTICITLGQGGNWATGVTYGRYTWRPKADEYSRFHIPNCTYNSLVRLEGMKFYPHHNSTHTIYQMNILILLTSLLTTCSKSNQW
jgi:hypothetical protein